VEELLDVGEGEDGLEEGGVGRDRVDDLDCDGSENRRSYRREVNLSTTASADDPREEVGELTSGRSMSL
jgi:hypothetical protein